MYDEKSIEEKGWDSAMNTRKNGRPYALRTAAVRREIQRAYNPFSTYLSYVARAFK